jgi:RNA polymerase sigma-70 factor (ECF subfamily)
VTPGPEPILRLEREAAPGSPTPVVVPDDAEAEHSDRLEIDEAFRLYAPYVARIGYRLLGRDSDIDDLVQDVFLAAHRGLRHLRQPEAIKGWLATVAVRKARRRLKRRRLWSMVGIGTESAESVDIADPAATPEQRALVAQVYRFLDRLPVEQRIAWSLRFVEGQTLERVAELCGCSLATAKRRIKAAREAVTSQVSSGREHPDE